MVDAPPPEYPNGYGVVITTSAVDDEARKTQETLEERRREFLALARKRFHFSAQAESTLRQVMLEDKRFQAGEQWDPRLKAEREADGRPCFVVDRLTHYVRQIVNRERQAPPAVRVTAAGGGADKDAADIYAGIIRRIERRSKAFVAYEQGGQDAAVCGRGWFRGRTGYVDDNSFEQEILIDPIVNTFTVYRDPTAQRFDYADMRFCFLIEDIPLDDFNDRVGRGEWGEGVQPVSLSEFESIGDERPDWAPEGHVRTAEYYYIDYVKDRLLELSNHETILESQYNDPKVKEMLDAEGVTFPPSGKARQVSRREVKWAKLYGLGILDGNEDRTAGRRHIGTRIPVIPVLGDVLDVNGEVDCKGMVRPAKDTQRLGNYQRSSLAEQQGLAPRAPFIAAEGQIEGHEPEWQAANRKNFAVLVYKAISVDGQPVPPPQRNFAEVPIQGTVVGIQISDNDLRAVTGYVDVMSQEPRRETSGRAILARQTQGETSSFHLPDNLNRAVLSLGELLVEWIPEVYDTPRVLRIIDADEQERDVIVYRAGAGDEQEHDLEQAAEALKDEKRGVKDIYRLGVGRYDVAVTAGPSFPTMRQEAADTWARVMQGLPPGAALNFLDLFFRAQDWLGAEDAAERAQKLLPPHLQPESDLKDVPPKFLAQFRALEQQHAALTKLLNAAQDTIETKQIEQQTKKEIEAIRAEVTVAVNLAKLETQSGLEMLKADMTRIAGMLELALKKVERDTEVVSVPAPAPIAEPVPVEGAAM